MGNMRGVAGGRKSTPAPLRGEVIASLIAPACTEGSLKHWQITDPSRKHSTQVESYGDDLLVLSRRHAAEELALMCDR
jgi:hypothetical protein